MKTKILLLCILLLSFSGNLIAGESHAADSCRPNGASNLLIYSINPSSDEFYINGDKYPLKNEIKARTGLLRYSYYYEIMGVPVTSQLALPFGKTELDMDFPGEGGVVNMNPDASGIGDLTLINGFWLKNDFKNQEWYGPVTYLTLPTGDYDKKETLNLGENRYSLVTEFVYGKGFGTHQIDLAGSVQIFGENDEYRDMFDEQIKKKKQAPLFTVEGHYSKIYLRSNIASAGYIYKFGGETKINGTKQDDEIQTHIFRIENTSMLSRHIALTLRYDKDFKVENGYKMNDIELRFTYLFDSHKK